MPSAGNGWAVDCASATFVVALQRKKCFFCIIKWKVLKPSVYNIYKFFEMQIKSNRSENESVRIVKKIEM